MMRLLLILLAGYCGIAQSCAQATRPTPQSELVNMDERGRLTYTPYTEKGDIIPDFSHCGYMGGGVAIPNVRVAATIAGPTGGDDTPVIQAVIDSLGATTPGADGFRGAILLGPGTYRIAEPLIIRADGIVLRGSGNEKESGTVLLATSPKKYNVIEIGVPGRLRREMGSERQITDSYVPSGSRVVHVQDAASAFRVGDNVVIHRPSTAEWIRAIDMDSIPPRPLKGETAYDSFLRLREQGAECDMNGTKQWRPGSKDLVFERTVTAIDGDRITLDIPIVNALQKEFGGGLVYKYEFPERISQCGVENMYGMVVYDPSVTQQNSYIGEYECDENHANNFIFCRSVENAWVRNVNVEHFDCCLWVGVDSKFVTGEDLSAVNPISVITGGRRYAYSVWGQMNLFQRCYSSHHRHEFVLGASVAGPNAFIDGYGDMTFASSEPHQRWAAGCLYDNITIKGPDGSLLAVNRGWYGSGHGWSGAQIVFWNCTAPVIMVMRPPTAQNFAIGYLGAAHDEWIDNARSKTIRAISGVSRTPFEDTGSPMAGDGWMEWADREVFPRSLYYQQLKDRLGMEAVKAVMIPSQSNLVYP